MAEAERTQTSLLPDQQNGAAPATGQAQAINDRAGLAIRAIPSRKLYQDEIYGTKELSPLAVAIIDTPEFQRLGEIYQLGFTHTVFRGGNHHRLAARGERLF